MSNKFENAVKNYTFFENSNELDKFIEPLKKKKPLLMVMNGLVLALIFCICICVLLFFANSVNYNVSGEQLLNNTWVLISFLFFMIFSILIGKISNILEKNIMQQLQTKLSNVPKFELYSFCSGTESYFEMLEVKELESIKLISSVSEEFSSKIKEITDLRHGKIFKVDYVILGCDELEILALIKSNTLEQKVEADALLKEIINPKTKGN